jgi:FtsP/CotA-like multicopper oxidase with cupredoxin domain
MTERSNLTRRDFVKWGGIVVAAGVGIGSTVVRNVLEPASASAAINYPDPDVYLGGTDGWIHLPETPAIPPYHPDNLAPGGLTTYIFGFHNLTGLNKNQVANQKEQAQHSAPLMWTREGDEFRVKLTNLGLALRPDLFDAHTVHWHGFRDVIPFFDGEPTGSVSVPAGREFTYVYRPMPGSAGTYMYHCHVEDVEHVQMGMTGMVFIRPAMGDNYAFNDASTAFDREFSMMLTEVWAEAHWADAHIQLPEWSDYRADFSMINGRVYPDTLEPNAPVASTGKPYIDFDHDNQGNMLAPAGRDDLQYQPLSSLVTCMPGEKVLLRFANLGFKQSAMTLAGIRMRVIGKDATQLKGRNGADTSYETDTIIAGAGESVDALFTAPAFSGGSGSSGQGYDTYVLYNRAYTRSNNLESGGGFGGQRTEVRVYPSGLSAQQYPNDWGTA